MYPSIPLSSKVECLVKLVSLIVVWQLVKKENSESKPTLERDGHLISIPEQDTWQKMYSHDQIRFQEKCYVFNRN